MYKDLTTKDRLNQLRKDSGLTLEEVSKKTGIPISTLSNIENTDFQDINHSFIIKLAGFYGVSTDYLAGLIDTREPVTAPISGLHLDDETIRILKEGRLNTQLLCELIKHPAFETLLQDLEIFVDGHVMTRIAALNYSVDAARQMIKEKYDPAPDDMNMKTLEAAHINEYQYFYTQIHHDIEMIVRDIREKHINDSTSSPDASAEIDEIISDVKNWSEFEGSELERQTRFWLSRYQIKYDTLNRHEFEVLMDILRKSPLLKKKYASNKRGQKNKRR